MSVPGLNVEPPKTLCEGHVWGAVVRKHNKKQEIESLPRVYVKAYEQLGRKPYLLVMKNTSCAEAMYMLQMDGLHSVQREAREDNVTFFFTFSVRYRIRTTDTPPLKSRRYVLVCKPEEAEKWDKMLATEAEKEHARKRTVMKNKVKNLFTGSRPLVSSTNRQGKSIPSYTCDGDSSDDDDYVPASPGTSKRHSKNHLVLPHEKKSEIWDAISFSQLDLGDESPVKVNMPRQVEKKSLISRPSSHPSEKSHNTIGASAASEKSKQTTPQSIKLDSHILETTTTTYDNKSSVASDTSSLQSSELGRLNPPSDSTDAPDSDSDNDHPFKTFDQLINTPENIRFQTYPHPVEYNILLNFEAQIESGNMTENNWELAMEQTSGIECRMWRKKLPSTVSQALLLSGQFCEIDAPPELVFHLIYDSEARLSWDDNVKSIVLVEGPDEHNREIEHTVMKAPMGFANREFLKYRMSKANYQQYPYMMLLRSMERDDVAVGRSNVRAESVINGYIIRPDPKNPAKTRITIAANTDIKGLIPTWTVNALSARLPPKWIGGLETACKSFMKKHKIPKEGANLSKYLPTPGSAHK